MQKLNKFLFKEYSQCRDRFWFRMNETEHGFSTRDMMQDFFVEQKKQIEQFAFKLLSKRADLRCEQQKEIESDFIKVKIDICATHLKSGQIDIYEVYNSRGFKSHRLWDLAFLKMAIKEAGHNPGRVFAICINPDYHRNEGEIDAEKLLNIIDLTQKVNKLLPKVEQKLQEALEFASKKEFELYPNHHHCNARDCMALLRFKSKEIVENKIEEVLKENETAPLVRLDALEQWMNRLHYPIYFLDYEAVTSNIPVYPNSKPFQHVVFQYSLHKIAHAGAEAEHFEFIPESKAYPVLSLLKSLISNIQNDNGSILVWHDSFEKARHKEMASLFPEYADVLFNINSRIIDMERVFNQDGGYYLHPDFKGKSSLKKVFPVLLPEEPAYDLLDVGDGMMASILWHRFLTDTLGENYSFELLRKQLSEYCGLDTEAMVKILGFLLQIEFSKAD